MGTTKTTIEETAVELANVTDQAMTPLGCELPVARALPLAVRRIVESLHPEKIVLFGSYAYGEPTPDSDVDLLVIIDTTASRSERSWSVSRLLIPRPFGDAGLVRTPAEIEQSLRKHDFFVQEILSRGKVLYEHRN